MDSLLVRKLDVLINSNDTLIGSLQSLSNSVESLRSEGLFIKFLPFLGVIVGGAIAYISQYSLKKNEIGLLKVKEKRDSINKIISNLTLLKFFLKELAYLEVDSKFQYYQAVQEVDSEATLEDRKKASDEHYNDYRYIAELRMKISSAISEVHSYFNSYFDCMGVEMDNITRTALDDLTVHLINLKKCSEFDPALELKNNEVNEKVGELQRDYFLKIDPLVDIVKKKKVK